MKHSSCDPYQVCVCGRQVVLFWYFVPSWNFVEGLVCLEPFSLLGVWYLSFCVYQWISHSLMYLSVGILQVLIYSFGIFSSLGISLSIGINSWKYWACILTSCSIFGMLSFFDQIYRGSSTKSQIGWDVHEIYFRIYMHIFMWSLSYVLLVL